MASIDIKMYDEFVTIPSHLITTQKVIWDSNHPNLEIILRRLQITEDGRILLTFLQGYKPGASIA